MLIICGVLFIGVALLIGFSLDFSDGEQSGPADTAVIDVIPGPLAKEELQRRGFDSDTASAMPVMEEGGWILTADKNTGKLAQRYRFLRLDPNPPGMGPNWVGMDKPRAEFYLADGRVVTLTGDSALVHLPHRVLESGTITGNVTIKLFEPPAGMLLDE